MQRDLKDGYAYMRAPVSECRRKRQWRPFTSRSRSGSRKVKSVCIFAVWRQEW